VADGQLQGWHSSLQSAVAIQPVPCGSRSSTSYISYKPFLITYFY